MRQSAPKKDSESFQGSTQSLAGRGRRPLARFSSGVSLGVDAELSGLTEYVWPVLRWSECPFPLASLRRPSPNLQG